MLLMIIPVCGQNVQLKALGLSGGAVWAQNKWDPGYAGEINLDMGEVLDFVFLQPMVSFLHANKIEKINGVEDKLELYHIIFGTKILGYITSRPKGPYFGAALNYHIISSERFQRLELSNSEETLTSDHQKVSMSVLTGYIQKFRRISIFLEARYTLVPDNFSHALLTTGFLYHL